MARVPYLEESDLSEHAGLLDRIKRGRRGKLLNPYKALLHAPELARAWFEFTNTVRTAGSLDARLRELMVVLIARLTASAYVSGQHIPTLAIAAGVTLEECFEIQDWRNLIKLSLRERAALCCTEEMMKNGKISDSTFNEVKDLFSLPEQIELMIVVGMYDMARLVFDTLEIDPEKNGA